MNSDVLVAFAEKTITEVNSDVLAFAEMMHACGRPKKAYRLASRFFFFPRC